jgi:oxygen-independent coproporphyrinogen III oxidase
MTIAQDKDLRREAFMRKAQSRIADWKKLQEAGLICKHGDFFPSVHYPPITMYPPTTEEELFATYTLPESGLFDIYAHIPFCRQRCLFCHYPVQLGERDTEKDRYLDALEKEMDIYMRRLGIDKIKARSILIGGGTPTYLTLDQLDRFLNFFVQRVDLSSCTQFNYDVDPVTLIGTEGRERLRIMRSYGVDRLTIGIQSLNADILKKMNRHHGIQEALDSIVNCKEFGFQVNIEFIFGYPGQTLDNWIDVIEQAVRLDVDEIQLYRLKIEAYGDYQGPIKNLLDKGRETMPTVEETLMMKQLAIEILNENGYYENLRRVYSKKREHYSHYADNQCCGLLDQLGFGLTAFSSLRDRFVLNTQSFEEYYAQIAADRMPLNRGYVRTKEDQMRWAIVLPLKNRAVWKSYFEQITGGTSLNRVFRQKIENLKAFDLITEDDEKIQLTKLGAFFADEVAQQFHHPDYMPFSREEYARGSLYPYDNCEPE